MKAINISYDTLDILIYNRYICNIINILLQVRNKRLLRGSIKIDRTKVAIV